MHFRESTQHASSTAATTSHRRGGAYPGTIPIYMTPRAKTHLMTTKYMTPRPTLSMLLIYGRLPWYDSYIYDPKGQDPPYDHQIYDPTTNLYSVTNIHFLPSAHNPLPPMFRLLQKYASSSIQRPKTLQVEWMTMTVDC